MARRRDRGDHRGRLDGSRPAPTLVHKATAMELRDAIDQITTIRSQLAATESLRSLRALPVALSGLLAVLAAIAQASYIEDPLLAPHQYLTLWVGSAMLSGIAAIIVMLRRARRFPSALSVANARLA